MYIFFLFCEDARFLLHRAAGAQDPAAGTGRRAAGAGGRDVGHEALVAWGMARALLDRDWRGAEDLVVRALRVRPEMRGGWRCVQETSLCSKGVCVVIFFLRGQKLL